VQKTGAGEAKGYGGESPRGGEEFSNNWLKKEAIQPVI